MTTTCTDCGYAFEGDSCRNPICVRVNPQAHAHHVAEGAKRDAERAERAKLAELWGKSLSGGF